MLFGATSLLNPDGLGSSALLYPIIMSLVAWALFQIERVRRRRLRKSAYLEETCRLKDIIRFLPDATFVIDRDRRLVAWNKAMEDLSGVPAGDMLGRGDRAYAIPFYGEARPALIDQLVDGDLGPYGSHYEHLVDRHGTLCAETHVPQLNGGKGAHLWVAASAFYTPEGDFAGAVESVRDITPRKAAESGMQEAEARIRELNADLKRKVVTGTRELLATNQALRSSEARYRQLVENLSDGYIFYARNTRGAFTYVGPSYRVILGLATRGSLAREVVRWLKHPLNGEARRRSGESSQGRRQSPFDLHTWRSDGAEVIFRVLEAPVFDEMGEVVSVEGIAHDVTEERRNLDRIRETEKRLLEAEKLGALGSLVAGLSHEINTPIGVGVTAASHLRDMTGDCQRDFLNGSLTRQGFEDYLSATRESANLLQSNLNRAADLLQNFKLVACDQSAGQARAFSLAEYFNDILQSLSPHFRNTGFRVRYECPADLAIKCDPGALYQIISNLVLNSLKHGFDGLLVGEIVIRARQYNNVIHIDYRDNGNGMDDKTLARIYEPFFTTKRGRGGTGLGMHIVYNNVTQNLGGTISCRSKPGRGMSLTITTPLMAEVQYG